VPNIEVLKRQRLDARLVGEFGWSIYQRVFDGVRVDLTRPGWRTTAVAFAPTQGGFARAANATMLDVFVAGATISSRPPTGAGRRTQVQGFGWQYRDRRDVTQRPDNSGLPSAAGVDIDVTTGISGPMRLGVRGCGPDSITQAVTATRAIRGAGPSSRCCPPYVASLRPRPTAS
jgi:hypothetical protein